MHRQRQCKHTTILLCLYSPSSQLSADEFPEPKITSVSMCLVDLNGFSTTTFFFPTNVSRCFQNCIISPSTLSNEFYHFSMHQMKKCLFWGLTDKLTTIPSSHIKRKQSFPAHLCDLPRPLSSDLRHLFSTLKSLNIPAHKRESSKLAALEAEKCSEV